MNFGYQSLCGAPEITMATNNSVFAEIHSAYLFSFHESLLRCSNVLGWSTNRWWRSAPVLKAMCYMRKPPLFLHFPWPSLPLHFQHLLPSCRGRSFSLPTPDSIHFLSSSALSSPFEHLPLLSLPFWLKTCTHLPYFKRRFLRLCCHLKILLSTFFPYQSPWTRTLQLLQHACMWITWGTAFEGRFWVGKDLRICISNKHPGDTHTGGLSGQCVHSWQFTCPLPANVPFFHLNEVVPKSHHWPSYPQIQQLFSLSLVSLICTQYHLSPVVTCHPSLEISPLGFTAMILLWLFFHRQLQFPLIVVLPPLATWRNLVTNQVMTLKFSICSLVYLCLCSFPQELSNFMTSVCIFQTCISNGTFPPNHIPTSN